MFLQELFVIESTKIPYPEQKEHTPDMDDSVVVQPANLKFVPDNKDFYL
jgi:hypothetical protein